MEETYGRLADKLDRATRDIAEVRSDMRSINEKLDNTYVRREEFTVKFDAVQTTADRAFSAITWFAAAWIALSLAALAAVLFANR